MIREAAGRPIAPPPFPEDASGGPVTSDVGPWAMVPVWVLTIGLKGAEVAVYVAMRSFADRDGAAWPRVRSIAERAGVSESTVERSIRHMRDLGILTSAQWHRQDGSIGGCSYRLRDVPPGVSVTPPGVTYDATPGVTREARVASPVTEQEHTRDHTMKNTPRPARKRASASDDVDFETFWSIYPRRIAKGAARTAWPKAVAKAGSVQTVLDGAAAYARAVAGYESRFIAYPATWLNQERWADDTASLARPSDAPASGRERALWGDA